jgi:hypothetical protein
MPISRKDDNRPNGVREWPESTSAFFPGSDRWSKFTRSIATMRHAVEPALVPPAADGGARFHVELFENMLHVLLHCAWTAFDYLRDLAVTFPFRDPFHHFKLTSGQVRRLALSYAQALEMAVSASVPGGHDGSISSGNSRRRPYVQRRMPPASYFQTPSWRSCAVTEPAQSLFEAGQAGLGCRIRPRRGDESVPTISRARWKANSPTPISHSGRRIRMFSRRCASHT